MSADEAAEVLRRRLALEVGRPHERTDFLTDEQKEVLRVETARLYDEYIAATRETLGENGPEPDPDELDRAAFGVVLESVLRVGYDLGTTQSDGATERVMLELTPNQAASLLRALLEE